MQNGNGFMNVYARPPGGPGRSASNSPRNSPRSSPRAKHGRSKSGRFSGVPGGPQSRPYWVRLIILIFSYALRRHAVLLLFPIIYISGMLLYMGTLSLDPQSLLPLGPPPGSVYRSQVVFKNLWPDMESGQNYTGSFGGVGRAWEFTNNATWKPCFSRNDNIGGLPKSNGYLLIEANGGLNQQRTSICNAVAVAYMLNATLVIPRFHLNSVWKDHSTFGQIYDETHFIESLADDVRIVRKLPEDIYKSFGNFTNIFNFKIKAWAPADYYLETVLPKLKDLGAVRFTPFANRLSFDNIPLGVQQLRCRTNFEALRFAEPITSLADVLVKRMVSQSAHSDGKFIGVHLRFEKDMVAFSCCRYDGGEKEKIEMDAAREKSWRGKFTRPGRAINAGANRRDGKCPLTPLEVGMILRGMGFSNSTPIYLAAGKIYKGEKSVAPLRRMFPLLHTKESLLSAAELEPFKNHSSRMAALDYTVCLHSEVFVTTQGGNFPQILIGHRRVLYNGHAKTIRPDKRKLAIILDNEDISWKALSTHLEVMRIHNDVKGHELRKPNGSIYTFPAPECMCSTSQPLVYEALEFSGKAIL